MARSNALPLAEWFLAGAPWLKHGSEVGKLLELLRDAVSAYDAASRAFIESAVLEQKLSMMLRII